MAGRRELSLNTGLKTMEGVIELFQEYETQKRSARIQKGNSFSVILYCADSVHKTVVSGPVLA